MTFNDSKFTDSAKYFGFCETKTKSAAVRLAAAYNKSRAYEMLGDKAKQATALNSVIAVKSENPYRETSLLTLGSIYLGQDKKTEALPIFDELVKTSADRAIIAEASIRAAVLYAELKKPEESRGPWDYYKLIGTTPGDQAFRPLSESACPLVKK